MTPNVAVSKDYLLVKSLRQFAEQFPNKMLCPLIEASPSSDFLMGPTHENRTDTNRSVKWML